MATRGCATQKRGGSRSLGWRVGEASVSTVRTKFSLPGEKESSERVLTTTRLDQIVTAEISPLGKKLMTSSSPQVVRNQTHTDWMATTMEFRARRYDRRPKQRINSVLLL